MPHAGRLLRQKNLPEYLNITVGTPEHHETRPAISYCLCIARLTEIELKTAGQITYAHRPTALFTSIAREH